MNIRPFQIVLLGVFAVFALVGIMFFAMFQGSSKDNINVYGEGVEIWGTLDSSTFNQVLADISKDDKQFQVVQYTQMDARNFDNQLLNAVAEGRSPDLILISNEDLVTYRDKLLSISYDTYSKRTFQDTYVDGAEIFLFDDGIYGLPIAVDPLMMYWNRDIFSNNGLANPPKTWEDLVNTTVPSISKVTSDFDVVRSAIAFGEYANIMNAKSILALLFIQSGSSIVTESNRNYTITLKQGKENTLPPGDAALSFYTKFASPKAPEYSWNRSLPGDRLAFTGGTLGLYFGFGSEYNELLGSNPNLNFDIAVVPQGRDATVKRGFGKFYALSIPRASQNPNGAFAAAQKISNPQVSARIVEALNLAPVHRNLIEEGTTDPYRRVLLTAALTARGWLDPSPSESENVFKTMIEDVTSGRMQINQSVLDGMGRLQLLF